MKLLLSAAVLATTLYGQTFSGGPAIDRAIEEAIQQNRLPGAVVLVGHDGHVVYRKAYGQRAVVPHAEAMTLDTIFER
jgi:CubicO group peptidase (beta-lactamase class C family)